MISKAKIFCGLGLGIGLILLVQNYCKAEGQVSESNRPADSRESNVPPGSQSEAGYKLVINNRFEGYEKDLERFEKTLDLLDDKLERLRDKCDKNAERIEVLDRFEKNLEDCKKQFEQCRESEHDIKDFDERLKQLENEIRVYDKRINDVSRQLNEGMVARMKWQLAWFAIILAAVIFVTNSLLAVISWVTQKQAVGKALYNFKAKADINFEKIYRGAMEVVVICNKITDFARQFPETPQTKEVLSELDKVRARFQVSFGNSTEVIVGTNILSQLGEPDKDIPILRDAIKREGLSDEVKETLKRAISDLEKKSK